MTGTASDRWHALSFAVDKSLRYHRRHANFFLSLRRLLIFLSAVAGTGVVAGVLLGSTWTVVILGFFVTSVGTIQLVFDLDGKAQENAKALEAFMALRQEINRSPTYSMQSVIAWEERRTDIEALHVAELDALNVDCHNQTLEAQGRYDVPRRRVSALQKVFIHFLSWQQDFPEVR